MYVVYTRWKNLKKVSHFVHLQSLAKPKKQLTLETIQTSSMVDGQVGYHRPENVRRVKVDKNNSIVNQLNKTKQERHPDLAKEQQDRLNEIQAELKAKRRAEDKAKRLEELERKREKEERSYDRIMTNDNMMSNTEMNATADSTAAEEFEDDFM